MSYYWCLRDGDFNLVVVFTNQIMLLNLLKFYKLCFTPLVNNDGCFMGVLQGIYENPHVK